MQPKSRRNWCALAAGAAFLLESGCATVIQGSSQNVSVTTEPPGAACVFRRDGKVVGVVNPTPGTLAVDRSHVDIEIACSRDGYAEAKGTVGSKILPFTLGNVILGGVVGVMVDATSGANNEYDTDIKVVMVPQQFATAADRDAYFAERRATFLAQAKAARERIAAQCQGNCQQQLEAATTEEQTGLARLDAERDAARIRS